MQLMQQPQVRDPYEREWCKKPFIPVNVLISAGWHVCQILNKSKQYKQYSHRDIRYLEDDESTINGNPQKCHYHVSIHGPVSTAARVYSRRKSV